LEDDHLQSILQSRRRRYGSLRSLRVKSSDWRESIAVNLDPICFKKTFRMERMSFESLSEKIKHHCSFQKGTRGRKQPSVELQLQAVLYYLGSKNTVYEVSQKFGIGEGTFYSFWDRVQRAIRQDLKSEVVQWPSAERKIAIKAAIREKTGLSECVGFIDATQVALLQAPIKDRETYWNRKKRYSINVQAVCDHRGMFISYDIGWPGSVHDSKIFWSSEISQSNQRLFGSQEYLLADAGYAVTNYCITPFRAPSTVQQKDFNFKLSQGRIVIEQAFERLKNRWPMLKELRAINKRMICSVIDVCIVLHNFLESCADSWEEDVVQDLSESIDEGPGNVAVVNSVFMRQQKVLGNAKRNTLLAQLL